MARNQRHRRLRFLQHHRTSTPAAITDCSPPPSNPRWAASCCSRNWRDAFILGGKRFELSVNQYSGAIHPQGHRLLNRSAWIPFPVFNYQIEDLEIEKSIFLVHGENTAVVIQYEVYRRPGGRVRDLEVRPLIAFRDYHNTTHAKAADPPRVEIEHGLATVEALQRPAQPALRPHRRVDRPVRLWYLQLRIPNASASAAWIIWRTCTAHSCCASTCEQRRPRRSSHQPRRTKPPKRRAFEDEEIERRAKDRESLLRPTTPSPALLTPAADQFLVARGDQKTVIAGYPLVRRLGPRHHDLAARPHAGHRPLRRSPATSCALSPAAWIKACCPTVSWNRAKRPSTTPSTRRCGCSTPIPNYVRYTGDYDFVRDATLPAAAPTVIAWHERGTRYGIRARFRRPAPRRRTRRATHLDGRQGGRLGGHAARRQAGGDPGALVQRPARDGALGCGLREPLRPRTMRRWRNVPARTFEAAFWNDRDGCLYDVVDGR